MRCKREVAVCCMLLLCVSLAWAHSKPAQTTSNAVAVQQALHEPSPWEAQSSDLNPALAPTNSKLEALEIAQRIAHELSLKGERATGDDCSDPIAVTLGAGDLPYVTSDTTCGRYDDYADTCLGYYDGGEDIIYELTLTEALCLQISVDGALTWVGVGIDDACPPGDPCIAFATDSAGDPSMEVDLAAGTYYVMIDTWPSPTCTDFTLTIDACAGPCEVPCPGGATPEGEPICEDEYDDTFNGGCNSVPPVFSDITCNETVCGQAGTFMFAGGSYRDTDWYRLELTTAMDITWTAKAEFPVLIFLIDAGSENCVDYVLLDNITGNPCDEISLSAAVGSGVYWLFIAPSVFTGVPCDGIGSNYVASLICEEPPPCPIDYSVTAPGSWSGSTCGADNDCALASSEEHMYEVTIPTTGMWVFSLCDSTYDTKLYVGSLCCTQDVGYNDDNANCGVGALQSELQALVTAGTYYVDIEGYGSDCGNYTLDVFMVVGPANDLCENAEPVDAPYPQTVPGTLIGATIDCPGLLDWNAVWYDIELPYGENELQVTTCPDDVNMSTTGIIVMDDCACDDYIIRDGGAGFIYCPNGYQGYDMVFSSLPGPGRILLPTYFLPAGNFEVTIDVIEVTPCDVVCDPDATPEGEPLCGPDYEDTYNGGCNSVPAVFQPIACGETICGESGTYLYFGASYRDTDWFEFTLYQPATVTWEVVAEFDMMAALFDAGSGNCMDYTYIYALVGDCDTATLTMALPAGSHWVFVAPSVFTGVECGKEWEGTLTVDPPEACTPYGACCLPDGTCVETTEDDCAAQDGGYQGNNTECKEPPPPPPPECTDPDTTITVEIFTDNYPGETTWNLVEVGYGIIAGGGPLSSPGYLYTTTVDACTTSCYVFTILDSFGDGICCSYGYGWYDVTYDGDVVATGGDFGSEESTEFGGGCGGGEEPADPCVDPDVVLTIEILTDSWGSETTWELVEEGVGVAATGGPYASNTYYTIDVDVCSTSCYEWTIFDAYGDGIYAPGGYIISWDGEIVASTMGSGYPGDSATVGGLGDCGGCTNPDTTITVEIMTDNYGGETTWDLVEDGVGAVASGGPYASATLYTIIVDVCSTSCYTFTIYDSFGDGICCAYGYGYYNVYYGAELVGSGGDFSDSDTVDEIGDGCLAPLGACWIGHCGTCVDTTDFCCEYVGGVFQGYGNSCAVAPAPPCAELDLKPSSCPNSFNRGSHGVLPVALMSNEDVDVMDVDISTIRLIRDDLVGGEVAPNEGPPGPHTVYADVGTPFDNEGCDCIEGGPDGIVDISLKFKTDLVVELLELDSWPAGTMVPLVIKGNLLDGSPFATYVDCLRLVPPSGAPGQFTVRSNHRWCWIGVSPMDKTLDMGGFPAFTRAYDNGVVVTMTATQTVPERPFMGWKVNGVLQTRNRTIRIPADGTVDLKAVYGRAKSGPPSKQGQQGAVLRP